MKNYLFYLFATALFVSGSLGAFGGQGGAPLDVHHADSLGITSGEENSDFSNNMVFPTYYGKKRSNFAMNSVNVVTGEFYINALDLKMNGPMPLEIRRVYSSKNQLESGLGYGWQLSTFPYLILSSDQEEMPSLISSAELDGSMLIYRYQQNQNCWMPTVEDNPNLINEADGSAAPSPNLFNNRIQKKGGSYILTGSDGSIRIFKMRAFPTLGGHPTERKRPYLDTWQDNQGNFYRFSFGEDNKASDWGQLKTIISSNGNSVHFNYDTLGHITEVLTSDGRSLAYSYDTFGDLIQVTLPDASIITYSYQHTKATVVGIANTTYSTHLLTQETKPEGRILQNTYDEQGRVATQSSTFDVSSRLIQKAAFNYNVAATHADKTINGLTIITDVNGNKTIYTLNNSQITQVIYPPQNNSWTTPVITQEWYTGTEGIARALKSKTDRRGLVTNYQYDVQGNLTKRTLSGNITGNGGNEAAVTAMTYNARNLLTSITDPIGHSTAYGYDDRSHPYNPTSITQLASGKTISTTKLTYQDVGSGNVKACGLLALQSSDGAITSYTYDGHGFIASITQKTGTDDPDITTDYTTNECGDILSETDALGGKKIYTYDAMGRRTKKETYDEIGVCIDERSTYYNENGDVDWQQGACYNPINKTCNEYDHTGHLIHKATTLIAAISNGSCVMDVGMADTRYNYDAQGNLVEIIDPNHHSTKMTYDALGQMMTRMFGNGMAIELFTYEPGGFVATHATVLRGEEKNGYTSTGLLQCSTHPDGTTSSYRYDLSGRLVQETLPNGSSWKTTYDDANRTVMRSFCDAAGAILTTESKTFDGRGNVIEQIDRAGNKFTTTYDGLNRVKSAQGPTASGANAKQTKNYSYHSGMETIVNGVGEITHLSSDVLGRPTLINILNSDGTVAKSMSYLYSPDHHSVITRQGEGENEISTTTYTDTLGNPIIFKHADGSYQITTYDACGNKTSFTDEIKNTTQWTYDTLNHLSSEILPGGTVINYLYNPEGKIVMRSMPQGLVEKNTYNIAGQKTSDALIGSDGAVTRNHTYNYTNGLLSSIVDPRGFTTTIDYDAWQHPISIFSSGSSIPEQNQITHYSYNLCGLLTSVAQAYADHSTGSSTLVTRSYDAYGQLISEVTSLNGSNISSWTQQWNSAGHRTHLNWQLDDQGRGAQYGFSYNALGFMTKAANASGKCTYSYADNGLLMQRKTPFATITMTEHDQRGNITAIRAAHPGGEVLLSERLAWRADGRIATYNLLDNSLDLPHEERNYDYDERGRLTQEPFTSNHQGPQTAYYNFDENPLRSGSSFLNGLGIRTSQIVPPSLAYLVSRINNFGQVTLDTDLHENGNSYPSISDYDADGEVIKRFSNGSITQRLTWDSLGRLLKVAQRNDGGKGYDWTTVYDGLGRRIQTSYCDATDDHTTSAPLKISYYYDPEVKFLELGRDYFGRIWSLYGPDKSGTYGGSQGIGGLDATFTEKIARSQGVLNNFFGDALANLTSNGPYPWGVILGGYGAMPGSSVNHDLVRQWRGNYLDWTGFYYLGERYYDPNTGRFLSPDPLGHEGSLSLYDYCNGDPLNGQTIRPTGRM